MITGMTYTATNMLELAAMLNAYGYEPDRYAIEPEAVSNHGSLMDISFEVCNIVFVEEADELVFTMRLNQEYYSKNLELTGPFSKMELRPKATV